MSQEKNYIEVIYLTAFDTFNDFNAFNTFLFCSKRVLKTLIVDTLTGSGLRYQMLRF